PTSFRYSWCETFSVNIIPNPPLGCDATATGPAWVQKWPIGTGYVAVSVTATNAAGSTTATSYSFFRPSETTGDSLPQISGAARVGSTLSVTFLVGGIATDQWGMTQGARNTWLRCNTAGGACAPLVTSAENAYDYATYVVTAADVGSTLRVLVWHGSLV